MALYPLKFKPRYVQKMWGGRKIETILAKSLPPGTIGESWELYDFPPGVVDNSTDWISAQVAEGPLAGTTLHQLVQKFGPDLMGTAALVAPHGQFPILIKFLDAREDLSVQVHPDEAYAKANPGAHLKNEAWFVVQADPTARLLIGLKPGANQRKFEEAIRTGSVESMINSIPVRSGDCYYLPSGTVHALGAGVLAAEVQTPSDTTYRVFDFNRVDPSTGKLRALHIDQALHCIDFSAPVPANATGPELVHCDHFSVFKASAKFGQNVSIPSGEPAVLMFLSGHGELSAPRHPVAFKKGDTVLLPASLKTTVAAIRADASWLHITFAPR